MKYIRKTLIGFLTVVLTICMSVPTTADVVNSEKTMAVLDSQLQILLQDAAPDERIAVDIWLYETSTRETREQKISERIGIDKSKIMLSSDKLQSSDQVDNYIEIERKLYVEENVKQYEILRADYRHIQGLQLTRQTKTHLYYSRYAPMISAELTPKEIKLLACDKRIESIYYRSDAVPVSDSDISLPLTGADYIRDTLNRTGQGISIGMIDAEGLPDTTKYYFNSARIICDPNVPQVTASHADIVASVMVATATTIDGVTYEGIVPDATLYATYFDSTSDLLARIEWLLDQNVNIINMSCGLVGSATHTYRSLERWVDHVAVDHCVHFVKSAGNTTGAINSPGTAYNIVTVGSVDDKNTPDHGDDVRAATSSFIEADGLCNKPDLMAPGVNIAMAGGTASGTSVSTPHVAAVIAQICQARPVLKTTPEVVKAILTASISHNEHTYTCSDSKYDEYGAGVIDAKAAINTASGCFQMPFFFPNTAPSYKTYTFNISDPGTPTRISLSWLKYSSLSGINDENENPIENALVDLDLCVYDPDGVLIGDWDALNNNTEIADFDAAKSGTYTVEVHLREHTSNPVYIGLAWWLGET